jgi:hypothetical protein
MDLTKSAGLASRFFVVAPSRQTHIALGDLPCYITGMFPDRQTIASRVVLDDRSRLPWRFFGRLTTSALAA